MNANESASTEKPASASGRRFRRHRTERKAVPVLAPVASSEPAGVVDAELRTELANERTEILEPLLRRVNDFAERLARGEELPAGIVQDGIDLWEIYVHRLHDVHIAQFSAARSSMSHDEAVTSPLAKIVQDSQQAELRIGELRLVLAAYSVHPKMSAMLLSTVLAGSARSELAWERYEEDFAASSLPDRLTPAALQHWTAALSDARTAAEESRAKVAKYLERTNAYALAPATTESASSAPPLPAH